MHGPMMTVNQFALALLTEGLDLVREGNYCNRFGQFGYYAIYTSSARFYWYSVSGTDTGFAPDEVAIAITSRTRTVQRELPYWNSRGQRGFEATVRSGGHSYMLGSAPDLPWHLNRFR